MVHADLHGGVARGQSIAHRIRKGVPLRHEVGFCHRGVRQVIEGAMAAEITISLCPEPFVSPALYLAVVAPLTGESMVESPLSSFRGFEHTPNIGRFGSFASPHQRILGTEPLLFIVGG